MNESRVIELYAKYDNCRQVAETLGLNNETVRRVLIRNGIKRTGNRPKRKQKTDVRKPSNCHTRYCPALVVMVRGMFHATNHEIEQMTKVPYHAVYQILKRERPDLVEPRRKPSEETLSEIEHEYLNGATTFELGGKYGYCPQSISKWMRKRGHARGHDWFKDDLRECAVCGKRFEPRAHNSKCCSKRCHNLYSDAHLSGYKRRAEKYGADFDPTVTLEALYDRDGGVCQICGERCDYESVSANGKGVGHLYPTLDHINPLKNGGSHTWDNVQLAHHFCNSKKREHELTEELKRVISHAKEQAVGNQCA